MKERKSIYKEWLYATLKKRSIIIVSIIVFLLLFLGGMRFNIYISFLFAALDSLFMVIAYLFFYRLLKQKKKIKKAFLYITTIILCLLLFSFFITFLELLIPKLFFSHFIESVSKETLHHIFVFRFVKNMLLMVGVFSMVQYNYLRIQEQKNAQMSIEKEHIRFQFLKAQINSHFLFNALNNIYSLAYTKDEKTPDAVIKLADMLRYVIDMSSSDKIQLNREINYIKSYLDFQMMRLETQPDIKFDVDVDNVHQFIAPMILQPYIENCFTHGDIATNPNGYVHITLHVKNGKLKFTLSNSKEATHYKPFKQQVGLGKSNVEERLHYFYTNAFTLSIQEEETFYSVMLYIDLNRIITDEK